MLTFHIYRFDQSILSSATEERHVISLIGCLNGTHLTANFVKPVERIRYFFFKIFVSTNTVKVNKIQTHYLTNKTYVFFPRFV
jgi:hypothetical protein